MGTEEEAAVVGVTCNATFDGKPLSVLTDLLAERQRILGESVQDAVVATGIDALVSLRALTKIAPKRIPKADVRFGETEPKYITGTKGKATGQLFRRTLVKRWRNGRQVQLVKWQRVDGIAKNRRASAKELSAAWQAWGKINQRGLAKAALGIAMKSISTRNAADSVTPRALRLAHANVSVRKNGYGNMFRLVIHDSLDYAALALKGGPAAVNLALQRAANKIAGRLSKVAEKRLGEKIPTPFPEVLQRRAS